MKFISLILILALLAGLLAGCGTPSKSGDIAATTMPVYQFTAMLVEGTGLTVTRLVTENVSCLHDYSLNVNQVKAVEAAQLVVLSGAGLEDFMSDILEGKQTIDASAGIELLEGCHGHEHEHDHGHVHEQDAHIWLSPDNAMAMAKNIRDGLATQFPEAANHIHANFTALSQKIQSLLDYGYTQLSHLSCREMVTFHDGFAYFADAFDLTILAAVEEEAGSETSAHQLIELIEVVEHHHLPAIFIEANGSDASAKVISAQTGAAVFTLNMAMSEDWFAAMYHNIDTIKEALG